MTTETKRDKYPERKILISSNGNKAMAMRLLENLPIFTDKPLEVVIREEIKERRQDQNSRMWAGPLRDFSEQVFISGYTYSADEWHDELRNRFMPAEDMPIAELERHVTNFKTYRKFKLNQGGDRVLDKVNCTTTKLTPYGMSIYLEQIHAYGAAVFGVMFRASPKEQQRYAA